VTKISQLSSIGDSLAVDDQFLIRDVDDGTTPNKSVTVSGITRALPLGSATAPALAFASDKNTGLFSPGADQVSVATNGVERLRVNATGQVGAVSLGTDTAPAYSFTGDPNTGLYSPGADQLAISTNGTGRLFVDASGRVGVGTSSLTRDLVLYKNAAPAFHLQNSTSGASDFDGLGFQLVGADASIINYENGYLNFFTNSTERMRLDPSGRLGLGTSSPAELLDITTGNVAISNKTSAPINSANFPGSFKFNGNGHRSLIGSQPISGEIAFVGAYSGTTGTTLTNLSFSLRDSDQASPVERMRITGTGRVGIGTTSPGAALSISKDAGTGTQDLLTINNANTTYAAGLGPRIQFQTGTGTALGFLSCQMVDDSFSSGSRFNITNRAGGSGYFDLVVNGSERLRVDSSGRVLIGTSTSRTVGRLTGGSNFPNQANAQIEGSGGFAGLSLITNRSVDSTGSFITLGKSRAASLGGVIIVANNDDLGGVYFVGADGTDIESIGGAIQCQVDGTPGANDMPGRLVFSTTADGAASPTERLRITSAGVLQVADAGNITVGTTTGTKIGTATTQKIGFYNATPVVQPTAVADATDAATVITQLNALLAKLRTLGIIAT
jgi:hypothetical protein